MSLVRGQGVSSGGHMTGDLLVGIAEVDITPPAGKRMDGYISREEPGLGAHDALLAQVLLLEHDEKRAAIVAVDTLAVSSGFAGALREALAGVLDTQPAAILICASHTHAGPCGLQNWFPPGAAPELDQKLVEAVSEQIMDAARAALDNRAPAVLTASVGQLAGVGGDRNEPERSVDQQITVWRFRHHDGQPLAIVFHYACHPTVLGADNRLYSADFVGAARRRIRKAFPGAVPVFINGAAGNISTRFLRREQSFEAVERLGQIVGDRVIALVAEGKPEPVALAWATEALELPFRRFAAPSELSRPTAASRLEVVRAEGRAIETQLARALAGRHTQTAVLSAFRIGSWILVGVPGEPFDELALAVRAEWPGALIAGYANDYLGYFPSQSAIEMATYEALSSPYDVRAHELLRDGARRLIRQLLSNFRSV